MNITDRLSRITVIYTEQFLDIRQGSSSGSTWRKHQAKLERKKLIIEKIEDIIKIFNLFEDIIIGIKLESTTLLQG